MSRSSDTFMSEHQQLVLLLPWYVNRSLADAERRQVERHVKECVLCRREISRLQNLAKLVQQPTELDLAARNSFAAVYGKLQVPADANRQGAGKQASTVRWLNRSRLYRIGAGLAVAASLFLALLPVLPPRQPADAYLTLAAPLKASSAQVKLKVVFSPALPDSQVDAVLQHLGAVRVGEPNAAGALTVALSQDAGQALTWLRARPDVVFAEFAVQP